MTKKQLLIIMGPTAVGKTGLSIKLAKRMNGEIISADSMQIYKHMDIGTAKPSKEETQGIPHHLMDIIEPDEEYSVAIYQKAAHEKIDEILQKNSLPIIVGGTGLYVNSIIYNMDFTNTISNWSLRRELEEDAKKYGNEYIHNKLSALDAEAAKRIHKNNLKRVIRAIEIICEGGEKIKDFSKEIVVNEEYEPIILGLNRNRDELYQRINRRVDIMIEDGLIDEVKHLLALGYQKDIIAFKGLGYKEIINYLNGDCGREETIDIIKRDTRRYAKRQLTWFKRIENVKWYNLSEWTCETKLIQNIVEYVEGHFNRL